MEDTIHLLGHAARDVVTTLAVRLGEPFDQIARRAGIPLLQGTSIKAALDIEWSDIKESHAALQRLLSEVQSLSEFIATQLCNEQQQPPLNEQLTTLKQVLDQDIEPDPSGAGSRIKRCATVGSKTIKS